MSPDLFGGGGAAEAAPSLILPAISFAVVVGVVVWEIVAQRRKPRYPQTSRRLCNIGLWLGNSALLGWLLGSGAMPGTWQLPAWASLVVSFLVLDWMSYQLHQIYHQVPWLWRLHALHHSDPDVDWSTAQRRHPLEYLLAGALSVFVVRELGMPGWCVAVYGVVAFALAALTHANVRWPRWAERFFEPVLITLDAHLLHHAIDAPDANFGGVLSIWDKLYGTYHWLCDEPECGVQGVDARQSCTLGGMLLTPWRVK